MTERMKGSCHCGAVRIAVTSPPTDVTECHCSICRRYATLWAYYRISDVAMSGPTETYIWGRKHIAFHRCSTCGCVMSWMPLGDYPECGVNARMLDGFELAAVNHLVEDDSSA
jgi:hypothetical protein